VDISTVRAFAPSDVGYQPRADMVCWSTAATA